MKQVSLYTGNGVSLSPIPAEGRTESRYVRLIADEGRAITDGETVTVCMDVLKTETDKWADCDLPPEEEETIDEHQ